MKNSYEVCMKLLRAESEEEVLKIIDETPEMLDEANWLPLDGRDTNFNTTSNQASDGAKALTELMTNMVDAVLMKRAFEEGIDPKGEQAPQTMSQAAIELCGCPDPILANLGTTDSWVRQFDEKLIVALSGSKKASEGRPCFTFIDSGEGQAPSNFPKTFLSLKAKNKSQIPFVQGKYNMGSSGVHEYSGDHWFKLIISRRYDQKHDWGWTLVRLRPDNTDDLPTLDYFYLNELEAVPSFSQETIYPIQNKEREVYLGTNVKSGTILKLYDYMTTHFPTQGKGKMREIFNENLANAVLPFRLYDCRVKPTKDRGELRQFGIDPRTFLGLEAHIADKAIEQEDDDESDDIENLTVAHTKATDTETGGLGEIKIKATLLSEDLPGWFKNSTSRIFHTVNGQVQFKEGKRKFTKFKLNLFKDRMVIIVDASGLNFASHNKIWKADRERIKNTPAGIRYQALVDDALSACEELQEMHKNLVADEMNKSSSAGSVNIFQELTNADPTLADLLQGNDPQILKPKTKKSNFKGLFSPKVFEWVGKSRDVKVQISRGRPLIFKTDVGNDYTQRANTPGEIIIEPPSFENDFSTKENFSNGKLFFAVKPNSSVKVGDKIKVRFGLKDDSMPETLFDDFLEVEIISDKKPGKRKKKDTKEPQPSLSVPNHVLLMEDDQSEEADKLRERKYSVKKWPEDFTYSDAARVVDTGDGLIYQINYDNKYHRDYLRRAVKENDRRVITTKYVTGMLVTLVAFEKALAEFKKNRSEDYEKAGDSFDEYFRDIASKSASSVILALAEKLPLIVNPENTDDD